MAINRLFLLLFVALAACTDPVKSPDQKERTLPYFGDLGIEIKYNDNGDGIPDTVYDPIPLFAFTNQEGKIITNDFMAGKIAVVDFFFTNCTSICPALKVPPSPVMTTLRTAGLVSAAPKASIPAL